MLDVRVHRVVAEVVLGQERILHINTPLLKLFDHLLSDLKGHGLHLHFLLLVHLFIVAEYVLWYLGGSWSLALRAPAPLSWRDLEIADLLCTTSVMSSVSVPSAVRRRQSLITLS